MKNLLFSILLAGGTLGLVACETGGPRPLDEYTYAKAAIEAAKAVDASAHSPGFWTQAEDSYREAQKYYYDHDWEKAKKYFIMARKNAEKAENSARLKKAQSGDIL